MGNLRSASVVPVEDSLVSNTHPVKLPAGAFLSPIAECDEAVIFTSKINPSKLGRPTYFREIETKFAQQQGRYIVKPKIVHGRLLTARSARSESRHIYIVKRSVRTRQIDLSAYAQKANYNDGDAEGVCDFTTISVRRVATEQARGHSEDFGVSRINSIS